MSAAPFDLSRVEAHWLQVLPPALLALSRRTKGRPLYALAFHSQYMESGGLITAPSVGANAPQALAAKVEDGQELEGFYSVKWNPADWAWSHLSLPRAREREQLYAALTREACRSTQAHWDRVERAHWRMLVRLMRHLAGEARRQHGPFSSLRTTPDFVAFVHTFDHDGLEWARRSIPPRRFHALFPEYEAQKKRTAQFEALPPAQQARQLVAELSSTAWGFDSDEVKWRLARLGPQAVPVLVACLQEEGEEAWDAVSALLLIPPDAWRHARPALERALHSKRVGLAGLAAEALALLEAWEPLLPALGEKRTQEAAASGLVAAFPRSLPVLEELLLRGRAAQRRALAHALASLPCSFDLLSAEDLAQLEVALRNPSPLLRQEAARRLGAMSSVARVSRRALSLLSKALRDEAPAVRATAAFSMGQGRALALPYETELVALARARREASEVREAARRSLSEFREVRTGRRVPHRD